MQYREIIAKSWNLTKSHTYLNWLAVIPLAIEFILMAVYMPLRWGLYIVPDILSKTYHLIEREYVLHQMETMTVLITLGLVFIAYLLVPTFCEGALIGTTAKILHEGDKKVKKQFSVAYGLNVYLPLVELHALTEFLNPFFIFIGMSVLEQFNRPLFNILLIPAIIIFVVEVIIMFSLIYAKYDLVINETGVFESVKKSIKLVFFHITETCFLLLLLLLIVIRAAVNFFILFLIPILIYAIATFLMSFVSMHILYVFIGIGSLIAYYYLLKTASMLMIFITFSFVLTFTALSEKKDDIIVKSDSALKNDPIVTPQTPVQNSQYSLKEQNSKLPQDMLEMIGKSLVEEMERIALERQKEDAQKNIIPEKQILSLPKKDEEIIEYDDSHGVSKHTLDIDDTETNEDKIPPLGGTIN